MAPGGRWRPAGASTSSFRRSPASSARPASPIVRPSSQGVPIADVQRRHPGRARRVVRVRAPAEDRRRAARRDVAPAGLDAAALLVRRRCTFRGAGIPPRLGTAHPIIAPYQTYRCKDGELALGGVNEANWIRITEVLGRTEWRLDEHFRTARGRVLHRAELTQAIDDALADRTREQWEIAFAAAGVPCGPVQDCLEALSHPQTQAMGMLVEADVHRRRPAADDRPAPAFQRPQCACHCRRSAPGPAHA